MGLESSSETNTCSTTPGMHVVLLGDSTLDNVVWVHPDGSPSIVVQLRKHFSHVTNYAVDGFNSNNVLHGGYPVISGRVRKETGDPLPQGDSLFKPLSSLSQLKDVTHVVLSVGGNDIREILGDMIQLPKKIERFWNNYPDILNEILKVTPRVMIMLQYRPSFNQDHVYGVYKSMSTIANDSPVPSMNALMSFIYPKVFQLARQHNLPILDLPNSFDIHDDTLYRYQIEPSFKGGEVICHLIRHAVEHHDYHQSYFYRVKRAGGGSSSGGHKNTDSGGVATTTSTTEPAPASSSEEWEVEVTLNDENNAKNWTITGKGEGCSTKVTKLLEMLPIKW